MTQYLFSTLISHFINSLDSRGGVLPQNCHLLIVDVHTSHVTLEVVMKSMEVGLDLVTLPSHTLHRLQPLDISFFAPFKCGFKRYKDAWVLQNRKHGASKEILAMWVSVGLYRAMTSTNIKDGFSSPGIWPLDAHAVDWYLGPSRPFLQPQQGDPVDEAGLKGDVGSIPTRSHKRVSSDDDNTSSTSDDSDTIPDDTMAGLLAGTSQNS